MKLLKLIINFLSKPFRFFIKPKKTFLEEIKELNTQAKYKLNLEKITEYNDKLIRAVNYGQAVDNKVEINFMAYEISEPAFHIFKNDLEKQGFQFEIGAQLFMHQPVTISWK